MLIILVLNGFKNWWSGGTGDGSTPDLGDNLEKGKAKATDSISRSSSGESTIKAPSPKTPTRFGGDISGITPPQTPEPGPSSSPHPIFSANHFDQMNQFNSDWENN